MLTRIKAFLIHLGLSSVIAIIALGVFLCIWYPSPLARATGGTQLFLMLLTINMIIGPLLTLLIYKQDKQSLKFDLSIIIFLQVTAFIYGSYHIIQGRPVWIVFTLDKFELIRNNDILEESANHALLEFRHASWLGPKYAALSNTYSQKRNNNLFGALADGFSAAQYPDRYIPLAEASWAVKSAGQNLKLLEAFNEKSDLDKILQKYPEANSWLPLQAKAQDMVVLINRDKAKVVKVVDLRPWN